MEAENTKNGWVFISKDQGLFTKRRHPTAPTRTASQNGQIERLWNESRLSSQKQNSTNNFGWKSQIQSYISKTAAQQQQSLPHHTNSGTASNPTSLISESSDQQRIFTYQRKNASSSIPTRTRGSWSGMAAARTSTRYGISQGRTLWYQGMWCLSRESQSNRPRQSMSKNPGSFTIQPRTRRNRW